MLLHGLGYKDKVKFDNSTIGTTKPEWFDKAKALSEDRALTVVNPGVTPDALNNV